MIKKLVIIGGTSGFGKWLARFVKNEFQEIETVITGRNLEKGKKAEKETGARFSANNFLEVKNADIVVFSVPISTTKEVIKELGPHINTKAIVSDTTSIKGFPVKYMEKYCPKTCTIIPIHPMFGPSISSIASQVFVLCPEEKIKKNNSYIFLKNYLEEKGAKTIESSPEEHDEMMAVVQGLTHFSLFTIGETIRRLGIDVKFSQKFVSPVYKILLSSVSRYMGQNPGLYADIQMNNDAISKVHKIFKEVRGDFSKFVKEKDKKSFIETVEKTKKHFGKNAVEGQQYTDKIIFLISKQVENIKENIGNLKSFENIYTRKKIKEIIKKFDEENGDIFFQNGKKININEWIIIN